jgi:hypothetical protein
MKEIPPFGFRFFGFSSNGTRIQFSIINELSISRTSFPVGSASIILGKVESGQFFYFFVTRSEPFREFSCYWPHCRIEGSGVRDLVSS